MNQNETNEQAGCGGASNQDPNEAEMEKELEALIDGNETTESSTDESDEDESDADESDEGDAVDPCADAGGCGGGAPVAGKDGNDSDEGGGCAGGCAG